MPFEVFVALRYLREGRAQTALILAAVSVGVSVIVFLSALIDGLQASLLQQTLGAQPHVTLSAAEEIPRPQVFSTPALAVVRTIEKAPQRTRSIDQWARALREAGRTPGVVAASPSVVSAGFAIRGNAERPILVRGVDPERFARIVPVDEKMRAGAYSVSGDDVLVGVRLARDLDVGVGDKIRIASPDGKGTVVTVGGVFELGNEQVDRRWVLTSLRRAQTLFDLPGGVTTLELRAADPFDAERIARRLEDETGLDAESWMTVNAQLLVGLRSQDRSKTMIQFFVVVAVALGIASVLIVSVVQKSREIGILRAVGTSTARVSRVFLVQGALLGLAGSVVGSGLGAIFGLLFEALAKNPDGTPTFPVLLTPRLFLSASVLATAVGVAAAVFPARRAARLDPAEAIRHG